MTDFNISFQNVVDAHGIGLALIAGAPIAVGDPILVLEAMKMEVKINAPVEGTVNDIAATVGDHVATGQELASIV